MTVLTLSEGLALRINIRFQFDMKKQHGPGKIATEYLEFSKGMAFNLSNLFLVIEKL
jgi:hypothetical protein